MYFTDPSLYSVTPREINTPFTGGYPFGWQQNIPRFYNPYQTYGLQHFLPYGMQHFYPVEKFYPTEKFVPFGAQQFVPPMFGNGYGYGGMPFSPPMQNWQRPFWY